MDHITVQSISDSLAYCGLVCQLCHLSDRCGGCRSESNCCGRHLSPGGCHQYNCCVERGLDGCWQCEQFPCDEDMFKEPHDVRLRAFVRYIREHGLEKLAEAVCNNQRDGIQYGHNRDYDGLGSENKVIALLNRGLMENKG